MVRNCAGWSYLIAMMFVVTSSGVSSAYYLSKVIFHFTQQPLNVWESILLTAGVIAMAWWPGYRDVKLSTKFMLGIEAFSVTLILVILVVAMVETHQGWDSQQLTLKGATFDQFRMGLVLAFMMLSGFESTTTLGEEAKSATSTLPKVMLYCLVPVGLVYVLSVYGLTSLSHKESISLDQSDAPLDMVASSIGLPVLGWISSVGVALSCFGCALGGFNAGSRVFYSMAHQRYVPAVFGVAHPRFGTPHRSLILFGLVALVLPSILLTLGIAMGDAMDYLMQVASFGFIGGYLLVCAGRRPFTWFG